jgi:hypothetical protein
MAFPPYHSDTGASQETTQACEEAEKNSHVGQTSGEIPE